MKINLGGNRFVQKLVKLGTIKLRTFAKRPTALLRLLILILSRFFNLIYIHIFKIYPHAFGFKNYLSRKFLITISREDGAILELVRSKMFSTKLLPKWIHKFIPTA